MAPRKAPVPVAAPNANGQVAVANNFFDNPFGDDVVIRQTAGNQSTRGQHFTRQIGNGDDVDLDALFGEPPTDSGLAMPQEAPADTGNPLRGSQPADPGASGSFDMPGRFDSPPAMAEPADDSPGSDTPKDLMPETVPAPQAETQPRVQPGNGESIRGMFDEPAEQSTTEPDNELPAPSSSSDMFDSNPFPQGENRDEADEVNVFGDDPLGDDYKPQLDTDDERVSEESGLSCDQLRDRLLRRSIRDISLDISPPFRPDVIDQQDYEELKQEFDEAQAVRQWRNLDGLPLVNGRLRDLAYQKAIVETEFGTMESLPLDRLSEPDLAYISENWGLPQECQLEQVAFVPRNWHPLSMTYKASNLCHKPLYFQEVNLERYGHTAGPVLQPVVSSAHFFANIAVLPYKMGVHSPHECQYALGYYRPGNCAPWIVPPVPISARGAVTQAAVMTGLFWLVP